MPYKQLEGIQDLETSADGTIKIMALISACYKSAEEGRVVKPEEM